MVQGLVCSSRDAVYRFAVQVCDTLAVLRKEDHILFVVGLVMSQACLALFFIAKLEKRASRTYAIT